MIVVYRQKSGSQRFKPEERLLPACLLLAAAAAAAAANNGDSQKKQKGRMDGWSGDGTWIILGCVWVCGCVGDTHSTEAIAYLWGRERSPTQKEVDYENRSGGGMRDEGEDGWTDGSVYV